MSAFMVSRRTAALVARALLGQHRLGPTQQDRVPYHEDTLIRAELRGLIRLNDESVCRRYPKHVRISPEELDAEAELALNAYYAEHFPETGDVLRNLLLIKAMECWMYQSCEEKCDEDPLWLRVKEKLNELRGYEVYRAHKDLFDKLPWG